MCRAPDTAHARRKFDEQVLDPGKRSGAPEALRRIAEIYRRKRLARRRTEAKPLWEGLHAWLPPDRAARLNSRR
ncbi:IS66 family transposase [Variovorax sp. DT-64]|uniref:IS66 family transposase n=1 Tax=Variovorax sp. DT-64 TaxID=3396160 RepID=UPI003F1BC8BE